MNLCPPGYLSLVHPLCIVWWKPGWPCMAVCLSLSHLISVATPCLECVHGSVHEFMSTLHPISGPPPMDSYMESWVPPCVTSCVSHLPWLWSYTLYRMCISISTWIYVHLTVYVSCTPYAKFDGNLGTPVWQCALCPTFSYFYCHTLFRMCTCISTWIYVYLTLHVWSTPYG